MTLLPPLKQACVLIARLMFLQDTREEGFYKMSVLLYCYTLALSSFVASHCGLKFGSSPSSVFALSETSFILLYQHVLIQLFEESCQVK